MPKKENSGFTVDAVKQAASSKWVDIIRSLGGVDASILDSKHHPCPKCGGTDRFRAFDDFEQTGGMLCNKCGKFADGFAALQWLSGKPFKESLESVASFCGLSIEEKKPRRQKKNAAIDADLEWMEWSSLLASHFLDGKPGITEESLFLAGAKMATYKGKHVVIVLPVIGESLDTLNPVGYVLMNHNGGTLPKWSPSGDYLGEVKTKLTWGSKPGLINVHGIECLKTEGLVGHVFKSEGISDMLAIQAAIPKTLQKKIVVVTNSNGAMQKPGWMAGVLATTNCSIHHDADEPGEAGADVWAMEVAQRKAPGLEVYNVKLPYTTEVSHGKDARDFLCEPGRDFSDLWNLINNTPPISNAAIDASVNAHVDPVGEMILRRIGLEILSENSKLHIAVYSMRLGKKSTITNIEKLTKSMLMQIAGKEVDAVISEKPDNIDTFDIKDVRNAIAVAASTRRRAESERGVGIWQFIDENGVEKDAVILVNDTEAAIYSDAVGLEQIFHPRVGDLLLDLGSGRGNWYSFIELKQNIASAASIAWRESVINETVSLLSRWRWRDQDRDPIVVTGLLLASFIQTIFDWRPLVAIVGSTGSGKSYLFEAIAGNMGRLGILGRLAFKQAQSSEAGIRQGIGNTAKVILCDEFEHSGHRERVMQIFRNSSRGEIQVKGSSDGHAQEYGLRHIGWVAAIESGLEGQADVNRFIELNLLPADAGQQGKLVIPSQVDLVDLGKKLAAIAIVGAIKAKGLCRRLKGIQLNGVVGRIVESYSVPAACLAVASDCDDAEANTLLESLLVCPAGSGKNHTPEADEVMLLDEILSCQITVDYQEGPRSIAQILASKNLFEKAKRILEANGIKWLRDGRLFIVGKLVHKFLLKKSDWKGNGIHKVLMRLPGAENIMTTIASVRAQRGVAIPNSLFNLLNEKDEPEESAKFANPIQVKPESEDEEQEELF